MRERADSGQSAEASRRAEGRREGVSCQVSRLGLAQRVIHQNQPKAKLAKGYEGGNAVSDAGWMQT